MESTFCDGSLPYPPAGERRRNVEETIKATQKKEDENLIKKSLRVIKELATGAAGSLIASGILSLLGTLNIG